MTYPLGDHLDGALLTMRPWRIKIAEMYNIVHTYDSDTPTGTGDIGYTGNGIPDTQPLSTLITGGWKRKNSAQQQRSPSAGVAEVRVRIVHQIYEHRKHSFDLKVGCHDVLHHVGGKLRDDCVLEEPR